jgi:hypothetical protein
LALVVGVFLPLLVLVLVLEVLEVLRQGSWEIRRRELQRGCD